MKRSDKIRRRYRVKLSGRLVEQKQLRLHNRDARQIQKLLLTAGKLRRVLPEPRFNAEVSGGFAHAAAYRLRRKSEAFKPERKLMPNLVRYNLTFRALLHKADPGAFRPHVERLLRLTVVHDHSAFLAERRKLALYQAKQRGFPASGHSADHGKLSVRNRERDVLQRRARRVRVAKGQIFDMQYLHRTSSFTSEMNGKNESSANAAIAAAVKMSVSPAAMRG